MDQTIIEIYPFDFGPVVTESNVPERAKYGVGREGPRPELGVAKKIGPVHREPAFPPKQNCEALSSTGPKLVNYEV
jgi:hypothetical protein